MSAEYRDARSYHTRIGWWLMTHEGALPILVGATALAILLADVTYAALNWGTSLGEWFAIGFLRLLRVLGDRVRRQARAANA